MKVAFFRNTIQYLLSSQRDEEHRDVGGADAGDTGRLRERSGAHGVELLTRFEMDDKAKKFGDELSKGMQQKVSICCALMHDPKVVIFDEPMVGLDPHAIKELKALFGELKSQGKTVIISTHMIDTVEDYWDVAHIMMKGKIVATKHNRVESSDEKSLQDLFFEITEGNVPSSETGKESVQ